MGQFDIHKWRQKQLLESYKNRQSKQDLANILAEIYIDNLVSNLHENLSSHDYIILKENILKKIKSKISKFSKEVKSSVEKTISKIGKEGLSSLQKISSKFPEFKKSTDLTFQINIARNLSKVENFIEKVKALKEQDKESSYPTISSTNEISSIKPDSGFLWDGETNNSYKFNGVEIINGDNEGTGLINGMHYYVFPGFDFEDEQGNKQKTKSSIAGVGALETEVKNKGFLQDLEAWLKKYKINYVLMALGIISVGQGVSAATQAATSDLLNVSNVDPTGGINQGTLIQNVDDIPTDYKQDAQNAVQGIDTQGAPTTDPDQLAKDLKAQGVNLNIDITDDANTATEIITHDSGEYEKSEAEKQAASKSLTEKLIDDINNILEPQEGQNLESIDLTLNYGGSISYQGGANSNLAGDGSNLLDGRANTGEDIANLAIEDVKRVISSQYGQEFVDNNLKITLNKIDTSPGVEKQQVQQTGDDLSTQASFMSIEINDIKTGDTGAPITLLQYQFAAITPKKPTPTPFIAPPVSEFGNLIREAQIAVIMALSKPDLSLFPYLNDNNENTSLGGYTQSSFIRVRDNESLPKEIRDLAKVVINARKKPDSFTSKIANILGVELSQRAKAQQLAPGSAGVGQQAVDFKPIKESLHLFYEILNEQSAIDQFLDSSNVNKNAGQILAYLGSMYASKDNKQIGIVDAEKLPPNVKSQLTKSGFKATSVGRDKGIYVFMDDRTSTSTPNQKPIGVPDDVSKPIPLSIGKNDKIFISPKDIPEFPKEFYNTKFYKDANKDGWVFINRKDKDVLPKGTKVKTFSIDMNKIQKTDYKKVKNTLE
jgi:hypothetical protein